SPRATSTTTTRSSTRCAATPARRRASTTTSSNAARTRGTRRARARTSSRSAPSPPTAHRSCPPMRRIAELALAGAVLAAAAITVGQETEEPEPETDGFWSEISHPHRARYADLIQQASALMQVADFPGAATLLEQAVKLDNGEPLGFYLLGVARE